MKHIHFGLANYNKTEIQNNEDFYNEWHNKEYYKDYLVVNENEKNEFGQVYENQKNDVHPPLYYLLLRIAMGFHIGEFSMWSGIIINIIIYIFITIFMYLIIKKILKGEEKVQIKSAILAVSSSITLASITNAIYIRMYALSTLNIVLTTYLHLKLLDSNKIKHRLFIEIGIMALIGSLTHYYYLFYLLMLFIMFSIKYIKEKEYKKLIEYISSIIIAGILSLIIFPFSIQHIFFGYRGQGVISNLNNISQFINNISQYILKLNIYGFNNLLFLILVIITVLVIYKKVKGLKIFKENNNYIKYIALPTLFYFLLVSVASPWIELRYIMPVCGIIFTLVIYYLFELLNIIFKEKTVKIIMIISIILINIMPFISTKIDYKIEPEVMYSSKKKIVNQLKNELNVPTIFMFNSNNNRFLDDILLFANINESYIAKDVGENEDIIRGIIKNKDLSKGIVVFINEGQNNDAILDVIKKVTGLQKINWIERLNACDVYYLSNIFE